MCFISVISLHWNPGRCFIYFNLGCMRVQFWGPKQSYFGSFVISVCLFFVHIFHPSKSPQQYILYRSPVPYRDTTLSNWLKGAISGNLSFLDYRDLKKKKIIWSIAWCHTPSLCADLQLLVYKMVQQYVQVNHGHSMGRTCKLHTERLLG